MPKTFKTRLRRAIISAAGRVFSCLFREERVTIHDYKEQSRMLEKEEEDFDEETDPEDLNELAEYGVESALISDQKWEDVLAFRGIRDSEPYPHILKVINYTPALLREQEEWLNDNCQSEWKRIGWRSSCSYTVAIGFMHPTDAVMYRLRWN